MTGASSHPSSHLLKRVWQWVSDPTRAGLFLFSFIMVGLKQWGVGGNLDTIWYSAISKNIYLSGDYHHFFISKYSYSNIFDHMPLMYWAIATLFKIFGPSDFVARLYPMICSFFSYILIFKIGERIKDRTFGLWAVLIHAICFGSSKWNGGVMHDVPLTTYFLGCFYFWLRAQKNSRWYYLVGLFLALGIWSKGPIILGFPLGVFLFTVVQGESRYLKEKNFWLAQFVWMAVLALGAIPRFDGLTAYQRFAHEKLSYLAPSTDGSSRLAYLVLLFQASTITVIPYLISPFMIWKGRLKDYGFDLGILKLTFLTSLAIIIPLSFFRIKYPHYLLPFYPFLSLCAAYASYGLFLKWPFDLSLFLKRISVAVMALFVCLPLKTSGKRSKEVLNLVNYIKLDQNIGQKTVAYLGTWQDDMTIFQHFKFYGSIDLKPVTDADVPSIDFKKTYLLIPAKKLPYSVGTLNVKPDDCLLLNEHYCVVTDRSQVTLQMPEYALPSEIY